MHLVNGNRKHFPYRTQRLYSSIVGKNLLSRIIKELGIDVLYQFGFTNVVIDRLITKGALGGEVDILTSIRASRNMFKKRYIKEREFQLFKKIRFIFKRNFTIKSLCLLSIQRKGIDSKIINSLEPTTTYEDFMLSGNNKVMLDRTVFFDALIFLVVELHKMYEIDVDTTKEVLRYNFGKAIHTNAEQIYYEMFIPLRIDTNATIDLYIGKNKCDIESIPQMYLIIKDTFDKMLINNIQKYCIEQSEFYKEDYKNHEFVNFAGQYKYKKLPNIFLRNVKDVFLEKLLE